MILVMSVSKDIMIAIFSYVRFNARGNREVNNGIADSQRHYGLRSLHGEPSCVVKVPRQAWNRLGGRINPAVSYMSNPWKSALLWSSIAGPSSGEMKHIQSAEVPCQLPGPPLQL